MFRKIYAELNNMDMRSAWARGIDQYAHELVEQLEELENDGYINIEELTSPELLEKAMLNGADNWSQYSWGGCSFIYNEDIAKRLCTPSELKKTKNGERRPNRSEEWLDTQARALRQACARVRRAVKLATIGE